MTTESTSRALLDVVAVMDRLRSPGGCPWDAEQTHASLAPYAIEEAHEVAEAAERGDLAALREELGDLLLQVVFHARVAQEHPTEPFDLADVARTLQAKLERRHPHVFGEGTARTAAQVEAEWEQIKAAESSTGGDPVTAVPAGLPALARAQKVLRRMRRAGLRTELPQAGVPSDRPDASARADQPDVGAAGAREDEARELGAQLAALVARAEDAGIDAEAALRAHVRRLQEHARR